MTEAPSRRRLPVYAVSVLIALGLVATYAADVNTPNADLPDDFRPISTTPRSAPTSLGCSREACKLERRPR